MAQTQGVADIAQPAQVPTSSGNDAVFQGLAAQMNAPLPSPYTSGVQQSTPSVPTVQPFTPQSTNNQPMTNQATSVKNARQKNNFAAIGNMVGQAINQYQEHKNTLLKNDITTVMQSKQNVENAQKVLQTSGIDDATKKQAQAVMDANKKQLQAMFSDPKKAKQLQKAFDISYVDPEQNKTPEIAQAIAAKKEVDKAGPLNYGNPQELAVAKAAGSLNELDNAQKPAPRQNELQGGSGASSYARPPEAAPKSTTPYADAALAKDMPTMEMNPQYQAALAQKAVAQKQYMAALPAMVKADSAAMIENAKAGNAQALAVFRDVNAANRADQLAASKLKDINAEVAGKKAVTSMQQAGANARTFATLASLEKRATQAAGSRETIAAIKDQSTEILQTEIGKSTSALNAAHANMLTAQNLKDGPEKDTAIASAKYDEESAQRYLTMWQGKMDTAIGTKFAAPSSGEPKTELEKPKMPGFFDKLEAAATYNSGAKNAGNTSTTGLAPATNTQRTDPTDAEYQQALRDAKEVGPTDDSSVSDSESDSSKY